MFDSFFPSRFWLSRFRFTERIGFPYRMLLSVLLFMAAVAKATVTGQCRRIEDSYPAGNLKDE